MRQNATRHAGALVATGAMIIAGGVLGSVPAFAATDAAGGAACAAAWSATSTYTGGQTASENGVNYKANWWTQGEDPATHAGAQYSGQPWLSLGSCTTDGTTDPGNGGGTTDPGDGGGTTDPGNGGGTTDPGNGGGTTDPGDGGSTTPPDTGSASGIFFSPYKDITVAMDWNTDLLRTAASGTTLPLVGSNSFLSTVQPNLGGITLAFATGSCDSETWAGVTPSQFIATNIGALDAAGLDYVVSTGGAAGTFRCSTGQGLENFISRYATKHMVGIDFDIENSLSDSDITNLVNAAAEASKAYPSLRFSFTLATWAASDASQASLNTLGQSVVAAIKASSLQNYTIDLMTMDYGAPTTAACVISAGQCDMGASAVQAAKNLQAVYGIPASKVEITPMIGPNDVAGENFTLDDVDTVVNYAKSAGLAGVHYWSLDRDNQGAALAYTKRFLTDLGR